MFNILKAIIFGLVEGITEWLPISSTGHLILLQSFIKFQGVSENFWNKFEVIIQLGAILAVFVLFFKRIWPLKIQKSKHGGESKAVWDKNILNLWLKIIVSCIPVVIVGLLKIDDLADKYFYNPKCIAIMLILVGIAFFIVENMKKTQSRVKDITQITYKDAFIIGLFQMIAAIFPGTSRSGATIIGALMIGISRGVAAEYTFYLALPAMAGASLLKLIKFGFGFSGAEFAILIVGMVVAFIVSLVIIKFFMNYIKKHDFKVFAWYRVILGIIVLACGIFNII